jgi:hypothetical protein
MKNKLKTIIMGVAAASLLLPASASAATIKTLLFNYTRNASNNMDAIDATALGVDAYVNVEETVPGPQTSSGTLDGVGYSMTHGDYYQFNFLTQLGQPYSAALEDNVTVSLTNLDAWLAANGAPRYEVTVYYAGSTNFAGYVAADSVTVGGISETFTLDHNGSTDSNFWAANGATYLFTSDTLTITDTSTDLNVGGISAIQITTVPEPSSTALLGLGGLALILRRRR